MAFVRWCSWTTSPRAGSRRCQRLRQGDPSRSKIERESSRSTGLSSDWREGMPFMLMRTYALACRTRDSPSSRIALVSIRLARSIAKRILGTPDKRDCCSEVRPRQHAALATARVGLQSLVKATSAVAIVSVGSANCRVRTARTRQRKTRPLEERRGAVSVGRHMTKRWRWAITRKEMPVNHAAPPKWRRADQERLDQRLE